MKDFKESQEWVDDNSRSGRPPTSRIDENVTRVRDVLNSNRQMSIRFGRRCLSHGRSENIEEKGLG